MATPAEDQLVSQQEFIAAAGRNDTSEMLRLLAQSGAQRVFEDLCEGSDDAEAWREYGFFLDERMGDRARAVAALKRAVRLDPSEGQARAQLAKWGALDDETDRTARLDDEYVGGLFDQFAASFDETLVEKLGYRGHLQCAAVLSKSLENVELNADVTVVDLGAGTGLCGAPLRRVLAPRTPHITAVQRTAWYSEW